MSEAAGDEDWAEEAERASTSWFDGAGEEDEELDVAFKDYEITSSPNDFNITTIVDFVSRGIFLIPGFQRNYVWDIKRASRLIESLLVGLPIPQLFLYEDKRNSLLVIDGQQRLMSIYYFVKGRFPKKNKRPELRRIMAEHKTIPEHVMADDNYFQKFNLDLKAKDGRTLSPFNGKNYKTLEDRTVLDLRTVRNIVIKQNLPDEERASSVFEIFNRLNTGGVNLRPQEIRSSLYHSKFTEELHKANLNPVWRRIIGLSEPDLHQKDVETLLRAFALVSDGESYKEPMSAFLNSFARKMRSLHGDDIRLVEEIFATFFAKAGHLTAEDFEGPGGRFNIAVFEAVLRAACADALAAKDPAQVNSFTSAKLAALKADKGFFDASRFGVGRTSFVRERYARARAILLGAEAGAMADSSFIDAFYERHAEMHRYLIDQGEVSFASDLNTTFGRSLVLAIASFFEHEVTAIVREVPAVHARGNAMIAAVVEKQVIARKYHTWFDWDRLNAGTFLGLFGESCKTAAQARLKKGTPDQGALTAFLELGQLRNRLVHQNYVQFQVEKTSEELYELFRVALPVLQFMREILGVMPVAAIAESPAEAGETPLSVPEQSPGHNGEASA